MERENILIKVCILNYLREKEYARREIGKGKKNVFYARSAIFQLVTETKGEEL